MYKFYPHCIKAATFEELKHFKAKANKEGVVMDNSTTYLAFFVNGMPVGFVGWMHVLGSLRYKSDWLMPEWRGQGIYKLLFAERDKILSAQEDITAYCTQMSLPVYLANGFEVQKVLERGSTMVKRKFN